MSRCIRLLALLPFRSPLYAQPDARAGLRRLPALGSWIFLLFVSATIGHAMTVVPPTFDELVAEAEQVVRVEIISTSSRIEAVGDGRVIRTYVRCRVGRSLKGNAGPELSLRLQGGQVGDLRMMIPGMPTFQAGERCVLFIEKNGQAFCPLVAAQHGRYRIQDDGTPGTDRVLRDNREPLLSIDQVRHPMHVTGTDLAQAASTALTLAAFENQIALKVSEQLRRAK